MIPQVKSAAITVAAMFIGAPLFTCWQLWAMGELTTWHQMTDALKHASLPAFMMAVGWIFFKSPFAGKLTELVVTQSNSEGNATAKLTINEPTKDNK